MEEKMACAQILWDYLSLRQPPEPADIIVGFGCFNSEVPHRAARLYFDGMASKILFTGGLGRISARYWQKSEAEHFADIALSHGVPAEDILLETASSNTAENILFTRRLLTEQGINPKRMIAVCKPYMERRIAAALPVYWPGMRFSVTSFPQTMEAYMSANGGEDAVIHMLTGDLHRILVYPERGYQLPQIVSEETMQAFEKLKAMGYTHQMIQ